jgi:hypothetical protein
MEMYYHPYEPTKRTMAKILNEKFHGGTPIRTRFNLQYMLDRKTHKHLDEK